jgi:hypothetical protein
VDILITNGPTLAVMLVNLDWAGRIGEARYPVNANREEVYRPEGAVDDEFILADHDMLMLMDLKC